MAETLYRAIGGAGACRRLAEALYARVDDDPLLHPFFPGKNHKCAIDAFTAFLIQFLGGPADESQRRWWLSLRESHARFKIGSEHRNAWMSQMAGALDDARIAEPAHTALRRFFEESSAYLVNRGRPPGVNQGAAKAGEELAHRWRRQRGLDDAVAAIRAGDSGNAMKLAESYRREARNPSVFSGLLSLMIGSRDPGLLGYVREKLIADPSLPHERYATRTMLHMAAASGVPDMVELLLQLGADPHARDGSGHTPLYSLGNGCDVPGGANIVGILVRAGADVNADDGVKRCTPLHMAARRGNTEIAEALLGCGAAIEAPDSLGHTPLRRAVNCNRIDVAALLLLRGADPHSRCKKGLTPLLTARSAAMKRLLTAESARVAG